MSAWAASLAAALALPGPAARHVRGLPYLAALLAPLLATVAVDLVLRRVGGRPPRAPR